MTALQLLLKNVRVYGAEAWSRCDLRIAGGRVAELAPSLLPLPAETVLSASTCILVPGFVDVHVHLREPGFLYKETIASGTAAGARGGYAALGAMPNLEPPPDSPAHLAVEEAAIAKDACIAVYPYGCLSEGRRGERLAELEALAPRVLAFSDDGSGLQSDALMREAMRRARALGKIVAAHCEDESLLDGGYIHAGAYARAHGHRGISSESEWRQIARDLALVRETGAAYHVCHISTKESVALIRRAKAEGLDVSCETGPHYLVLCDEDLQEDGRFKMNPPLRSAADREALLAGLLDGTIDMIATDHAPHTAAEKSRGLAGSAMGVVGLETAFAVLYTHLVRPGLLPLSRLVELMHTNPARRFGIHVPAEDLALWELALPYAVDAAEFRSMGKSTPFLGERVYGRCLLNLCGGRAVWQDEALFALRKG